MLSGRKNKFFVSSAATNQAATDSIVYNTALEYARRLNQYASLVEEPIPITLREVPEFAATAVRLHKKPIQVDFMIEAIREGRFSLGGHQILVI